MNINEIINILRCPVSNAELLFNEENNQLLSLDKNFSYKLKDGIPIIVNEKIDSKHKLNYIEHYRLDGELFDYFEKREKASLEAERRLREYILSLIPKRLELILDIGSGSAWLAKQLGESKKVISLDLSFHNIKKALIEFPYKNHFGVVGDGYHLPFADNSFDCIVCSETIEHLEMPELLIEQAIKKVKKNGTIIISTPYKEKIKQYLCIHCNRLTPQNAHLHSFDEAKLQSFIKQGVKSVKFFTFGNNFHTFLRFYVLLRYFSFPLWKIIDSAFSLFINKKINLICKIEK